MDEAKPTIFGSPSGISAAPRSSSSATLRGDEQFPKLSAGANARVASQPADPFSSDQLSFPPATPMEVTPNALRCTLGRMSFPEIH